MKKAVIISIVFILLLTLTVGVGVTAAAEGMTPYERAVSYTALHARRDILSGGSAAAAASLSTALSSYGYDVSAPLFSYYGETSTGGKISYEYRHVLGYKDKGKGKCVLIGCYYDGYEPQDSYGVGTGASVALSVGTLLYLAEQLANLSLDYDIAIAFWGGLEIADDFNVTKCGISLDRVVLYINLDCIAAGDTDYLYADDVPRAHGAYFRSVIEELGADIAEPPVYKRQASLSYGEKDPYSYTHLGLLSVTRFFMGEDIPSLNFVGGAWETDSGLTRYSDRGDIEGSSLDTVETIDGLNGGADKTAARLIDVANVVIAGVSGEGFSEAIAEAEGEVSSASLDNDLAFYLISLIGTAILIGVLIFLFVKQGKDRREAVWEVPHDAYRGPFEEFGGRIDDESSDDGEDSGSDDDVFRF